MSVDSKKQSEDYFILRIIIDPYVLVPLVCLAVGVMSIPYIIKTNDWSPIWCLLILCMIYAWIPYTSIRYRIWWQDGTIFQQSADRIMTSISISDINQIKRESSDLNTLLSLRRPSRRLTVYGDTSEGSKVIDVSLIHFNLQDVRKLMKMIHNKRPNLEMPKGWG